MAQVHQCDLCKEVSPHNFYGSKEYCEKCNDIIQQLESEAYRKVYKQLVERYEHVVVNQANVLMWCKWLYEENLDQWETSFGTQGTEMLKKALEK